MKIVHILIGIGYLIYSLFNITHLGIGEWLPIIFAILSISIAWFVWKTDLLGLYLAGMLTGCMVEYVTEAYWKYSFNIYLWKDISAYVILGWGFTFTFFVIISDKLFTFISSKYYKKIRHNDIEKKDVRKQPGIIISDALLGVPWFVGYELLGMKVLKLWEYREVAEWNTMIPVINYPLEGIIGAFLFGMILPSFVRFWSPYLKFTECYETPIR